MAHPHHGSSHPKQSAPGTDWSQRKPNLDQGAGAMSEHPDAGGQQRKPNLSQGADAMSRRPDGADAQGAKGRDTKR